MPEFVHPFTGMTPDRPMTLSELTRAVRLAMAAELEAVHLYEAQADATDHPLATAVLRDIANEEKVHAGEFQRLLTLLAPAEPAFLAAGVAEVDALAGGAPVAPEAPPVAAAAPTDAPAEAPTPPPPPPTIGSLRGR